MVIKVKKFLLLSSIAGSVFLASPIANAAVNLDELDRSERFLRQYYELREGLSQEAYNQMQMAEGLLTTRDPEKALKLVSEARVAYPEHFHLQILHAEILLALEEPERALLILDELYKNARQDDDFKAAQHFEILNLQLQAYQAQDESALALRLLESSDLQPHQLDHEAQVQFALLKTKLLTENDRSLAAYHGLKEFMDKSAGQQGDSQLHLLSHGPQLAESIYLEAQHAYHQRDYSLAARLAHNAYVLNPNPVKYAQLMTDAQERFLAVFAQRFRQAKPMLVNAISNMRDLLRYEDYNGLYREYLRLKDNSDVQFLLQNQAYLPLNIFEALDNIEKELAYQRIRS